MVKTKFKVYEYPIKDGKNSYTGSYTIKANVNPLKYKGEKLVDVFEVEVAE